ncbi:MAG: cohesin domain-containing protein, partial [Candidatus Parabeggiatoa sp.]|nr:cohesin domain-containing protein [Candidatus Parabeggiatoa sp.]
VIDPTLSVEFSWQGNGDVDNADDELTYRACYVNLAEVNLENISEESCLPVFPAGYRSETSGTLPVNKLDYAASYAWIVSVYDGEAKSEWDIWTFTTKAPPVNLILDANSGYANTLLKWRGVDTDLKVAKYRILRVKGDADFSTAVIVDTLKNDISSYYDEYSDEKDLTRESKTQYCYRIEALDNKEEPLHQSNIDCVIYGEIILAMKPSGGLEGSTVDVPINILNAGNLRISSSDIWLRYDSSIITVVEVKKTALTANYDIGYEEDQDGSKKVVRISIDSKQDPPPELLGEGPLVDVVFKVAEGKQGASSPLELVEYVAAQGGSTISDQDLNELYPKLIHGKFNIRKRAVREGDTNTLPRFYVGRAYIKGDLNGNGTQQTVDARIARFVGIEKLAATDVQKNSGDVNGDKAVNSGDAGMILYNALHQEWPGAPASEAPNSVGRAKRDGKETPIVISLDDVSSISGSEVITPLHISNVNNLSAMNLILSFDTNVIEEIVKVEKTGVATDTSFFFNDMSNDLVGKLHISMDTQTPIDKDGDIAIIRLRLASGGFVRNSPLSIRRVQLYDRYGRDFVISALQRTIKARNAVITITDIAEPVVEDEVMIPIKDMMPDPSGVVLYSAYGKVIDNNGKPMGGITITIGDQTDVSDDAGSYAIVALTEGNY